MKLFRNYGDQRQVSGCAFCGGDVETRDHIPARILLDEPFPENLPVVGACFKCNNGSSADEVYLGCIIDCVLCGTVEPKELRRPKIARYLAEHPTLQKAIANARREVFGQIRFDVDYVRVQKVAVKLARGHSSFELNERCLSSPSLVRIAPLMTLGDAALDQFENGRGEAFNVWPEVGSRAMQRIAELECTWTEVQSNRYRYWAQANAGISIRIVLSEYLACEVCWDEPEGV